MKVSAQERFELVRIAMSLDEKNWEEVVNQANKLSILLGVDKMAITFNNRGIYTHIILDYLTILIKKLEK